MREGISVEVSAADRARLEAVVADRNSPQKHVWLRAGLALRGRGGLVGAGLRDGLERALGLGRVGRDGERQREGGRGGAREGAERGEAHRMVLPTGGVPEPLAA